MKRKVSIVKNVFSVVLCFWLITFSVFFSNDISEIVCGTVLRLYRIKNTVADTSVSLKESVAKVDESVFSPMGFGGGGYKNNDITETPADIVAIKAEAEELYKALKKSGDIKEQQLGGGNTCYGVVKINNKTDEEINVQNLLNKTPTYKKITKDKPYILVYHTHTTECYELLDKGWYSDSYNSRTEDEKRNMVRVGDEVVKYLEMAGFKVIHDKTIYDKSYNGAYDRSRVNVAKYLEKYPSIQITLDVHRDAIHYDGGTKSKPTAEIMGKKAAQVMIISGCEGDGVENFPEWKKNLTFAVALQSEVQEQYSGLMRPIFFCNRKYNMNVTPCSLLLEFGTDANTLEEAVYSAALVGKAMGDMLNKAMVK